MVKGTKRKESKGKSVPKNRGRWGDTAWEGRFAEATDPDVARFTTSFLFDRCLYPYDIAGSIAHTEGLARAGLLTPAEKRRLVKGLKEIESEMAKERDGEAGREGKLPDEDIHMHIERRLVEKVGEVGGKLHTGRSRNDQIALDLRLYLRAETRRIVDQIELLQKGLIAQAEAHVETVVPGYTHLQRAQPVSLAHYFLAYYEMLARDRTRLLDGLKRLDQMPLGAGALAGNSFSIDRRYIARLLDFSEVTANSLDTVSDRDFVTEFLSAASILMMHLSRWAEDWILWASTEFGFIDLPDRYCTGSSMMPQKKNPDLLELIRGKTGRVYGALITLLTLLKGLPLTYNRDLQEDKEPIFDAVATLRSALQMMINLTGEVRFRGDKMKKAAQEGSLLATDLADYLVVKGLPFRQAHHVVGKIVFRALEEKKPFERWTLDAFQAFSSLFEKDLFDHLSLTGSLQKKGGIGGTSGQSIMRQIRKIKQKWGRE
ncbi:MAG: argininosuccinate lyase [Nitrospiria bacterium]